MVFVNMDEKLFDLFWDFLLDINDGDYNKAVNYLMRKSFDKLFKEFKNWCRKKGIEMNLTLDEFLERISEGPREKARVVKLMKGDEFLRNLTK